MENSPSSDERSFDFEDSQPKKRRNIEESKTPTIEMKSF